MKKRARKWEAWMVVTKGGTPLIDGMGYTILETREGARELMCDTDRVVPVTITERVAPKRAGRKR
jgi:hypothetical protein